MSYKEDLTAGAGLSFVGGMLEALGSVAGIASLGSLGTVFIPVGVIIVGFGLYERFFVSKLNGSGAASA